MTQKEMTDDRVIGAINDTKGNLTMTARLIGCARQTLYSYIKVHPTCQEALATARESMIDNVESVLYSKALEGEAWAVCFFLKTQAKHRGYVERQEFAGAKDGDPLKVQIIEVVKSGESGE